MIAGGGKSEYRNQYPPHLIPIMKIEYALTVAEIHNTVYLIASEDAAQAEARLRRRLKRQNMEDITIKTCLAAEMPGDTACQYVRLPAFNPSTWKHAHGTK